MQPVCLEEQQDARPESRHKISQSKFLTERLEVDVATLAAKLTSYTGQDLDTENGG